MGFSSIVILLLMLATLASLVIGLIVMAKGGEVNKKYSNKLMSYRVWLQAATVMALVLFLST